MPSWTYWLLILLLQVATCFAWPAELLPLTASLNQESILIDSRRPVAGNGDTASTLFLVQNLIHRGFQGTVAVLVDEKSERILRAISNHLPGFESRIRLVHESELPAQEYSLVIRTGMPSGRILVAGIHHVAKDSPAMAGRLNVNDRTVFISTPIYGNTKNTASVQPLSLVHQGDQFYLLPSPGLDAELNEAGVFRDPFSLSIRDWSLDLTESFLLNETKKIHSNLHSLLDKIIRTRKSKNIKYSLAYGFSIPQVKTQARDYFRSLLASPRPVIVLTPSSFSEDLLQSFTENERRQIHLTNLKEFSETGKKLPSSPLTVVQIPNVPHHIFAALLLASNRNRVVPLGAGDGFFTTALSLGIPFAPTTVDWNIRNIRALGQILQTEGLRQGLEPSQMQSLRQVYSLTPAENVSLEKSQLLMRHDPLFKQALSHIPDFTEMFDLAVGHFRKTTAAPAGLKVLENPERVYVGTPAPNVLSCEKVF